MRIYFDSSALVKRYIDESGTESVLRWCSHATELVSSTITLPEVLSAFCRLQRESRITNTSYHQLKVLLLSDIEDATLVDLTDDVLAKAVACLENNAVRAMDAIHVGSALALEADMFVSADLRQVNAAARSGLQVEVL